MILNFEKQILKPDATIDVVTTNIPSVSQNQQQVGGYPGWQKLRGSTGGTRRKVWTRTKILSLNIRYFVAN